LVVLTASILDGASVWLTRIAVHMLADVLLELAYKSLALAATVWVASSLSSEYLEALIEFTRIYINVIDLLHAEGRLPLRV